MATNDDETVGEKAVFIRDLVSGVSDTIQSFAKWKEEKNRCIESFIFSLI